MSVCLLLDVSRSGKISRLYGSTPLLAFIGSFLDWRDVICYRQAESLFYSLKLRWPPVRIILDPNEPWHVPVGRIGITQLECVILDGFGPFDQPTHEDDWPTLKLEVSETIFPDLQHFKITFENAERCHIELTLASNTLKTFACRGRGDLSTLEMEIAAPKLDEVRFDGTILSVYETIFVDWMIARQSLKLVLHNCGCVGVASIQRWALRADSLLSKRSLGRGCDTSNVQEFVRDLDGFYAVENLGHLEFVFNK